MKDIKDSLTDGLIKTFLKEEVRRPYQVIEQKLNELKEGSRNNFDLVGEKIEFLSEFLLGAKTDLKNLKEENKALISNMNSVMEFASVSADRDWVKDKISNENSLILGLIQKNTDELDELKAKSVDINNNFAAISRHAEACVCEIQGIKKYLLANEDLAKLAEENERKVKEEEAKERVTFADELKDLIKHAESKIAEYGNVVSHIDKTVVASDKRIKKDSLLLASELRKESSSFIREISDELLTIGIEGKRMRDSIHDLEQKYVMEIKSSKGDKELDDFMKQVGYNARQIAQIQQKLESS
jgi:hypothetical protein